MPKVTFAISYEIQKLGGAFKELRLEKGLSIRQVAQETGLTPSYLAKIEAGNTFKTIGLETMVRLCKFFRVPCNAILEKANYIQLPDDGLPALEDYLQLKYRLPQAAVREMQLMLTFIEQKYRQPTPEPAQEVQVMPALEPAS